MNYLNKKLSKWLILQSYLVIMADNTTQIAKWVGISESKYLGELFHQESSDDSICFWKDK